MSAIDTMTPTEAAEWLDIDRRTFLKLAKERGFTPYPGTSLGRVKYSKKDIEKKYLRPLDEIEKPKKGRRRA